MCTYVYHRQRDSNKDTVCIRASHVLTINSNISSSLHLFVDDCVVYRTINNEKDATLLQKDIDEISRWAQKWQMNFNVNKCVLLRFTRRHSPLVTTNTLNNQTIQSNNSY